MSLPPRAVVVHRQTELQELIARHGTHRQAAFYLATRDRRLEDVEARHAAQQQALTAVANAIPLDWRRGQVERQELGRFVFGPEDIVVAVGQDGLVANVAKYLDGQVVVGVNPDPDRNPGVLVRHPPGAVGPLLAAAASGDNGPAVQRRTMVEARTDDGQRLLALNEVYLGHPSHQSARYRIQVPRSRSERQSSSGILVGTGTGSTGWCRSVWLERQSTIELPDPAQPWLCWFVREAWPSPATGTTFTEGTLTSDESLIVHAESNLVIFGDGVETDAIALGWGQRVSIGVSERQLVLA